MEQLRQRHPEIEPGTDPASLKYCRWEAPYPQAHEPVDGLSRLYQNTCVARMQVRT